MDAIAGKVLAYRSIRQLLGDNYELLNRQRRQQRSSSHERHKAQKSFSPNQFGTSELGEYVDRLLAKEIIAMPSLQDATRTASFANAQTYKVATLLPAMGGLKDI